MEEEFNSRQLGIKYSIIFAIIGSLVWCVPAALRVTFSAQILLYWAYFIGIYILAMKEYKKGNGGFMSFGKGFGIAMTIAAIGGLLRSVIRYVYLTIDSEYFEFAKELADQNPFSQGQEQTEQTERIMEMFLSPEVASIQSFLGAIFGGLIFGAIVAAIIKNEEEEY